MPQYYFHVTGDIDREGIPLPSPSIARKEGIKLLGSLLIHEEIPPGRGGPCVEITDITGAMLIKLSIDISEGSDDRSSAPDRLLRR